MLVVGVHLDDVIVAMDKGVLEPRLDRTAVAEVRAKVNVPLSPFVEHGLCTVSGGIVDDQRIMTKIQGREFGQDGSDVLRLVTRRDDDEPVTLEPPPPVRRYEPVAEVVDERLGAIRPAEAFDALMRQLDRSS